MTKVHIITQGCSANQADSEVMAGKIKGNHTLVSNPDDADVIVFNTCTVKGPTESYFRRKLKEFESKNKKIVLAGCLIQAKGNKEFSRFSQIGTDQLHRVSEVVEHTVKHAANTDSLVLLEHNKEPRLNTVKVRLNPLVEIVPISQGCLSACTYCKTKHARGALVSTPVSDIVRHVSAAVADGVKEVWITSQDISAYGLDIGTTIASLLKAICSIDREFKIRVGMSNPLFITEFLDEYIDAFMHPKIYKFLHLPVQCGNDKVLCDMKRDYTISDFKHIVSEFRKKIPQLILSTDIICGFPTESSDAFDDTLSLIKEVKPDAINISKFWPREGTVAAKLKQLDGLEVKRRSKEMTTLYHEVALSNNKQWIGWKGSVLIVQRGKNNGFIGRNYCYKQVVIVSDQDLMGKTVDVEVYDASSFDLRARII